MSLRERIKSTIILSDFMEKRLNIRVIRKNLRAWACCPFHHENTPSFAIYLKLFDINS